MQEARAGTSDFGLSRRGVQLPIQGGKRFAYIYIYNIYIYTHTHIYIHAYIHTYICMYIYIQKASP